MKTRFGAAAVMVALMGSACGQREEPEPEPDPTANIDLPVMYNPDPSTLQDTTAMTDTTAATGSPGIVGDDTIPGPFNPDTASTPRTP
jgi:hypothetical protein